MTEGQSSKGTETEEATAEHILSVCFQAVGEARLEQSRVWPPSKYLEYVHDTRWIPILWGFS